MLTRKGKNRNRQKNGRHTRYFYLEASYYAKPVTTRVLFLT